MHLRFHPDHLPLMRPPGEKADCPSISPDGLYCTLDIGHPGVHQAGVGVDPDVSPCETVAAIWDDHRDVDNTVPSSIPWGF